MTNDLAPVNIAILRRRLGAHGVPLSQAALAEKIGVTQATVSRMEADPSKQKGPVSVLLHQLDEQAPGGKKRKRAN